MMAGCFNCCTDLHSDLQAMEFFTRAIRETVKSTKTRLLAPSPNTIDAMPRARSFRQRSPNPNVPMLVLLVLIPGRLCLHGVRSYRCVPCRGVPGTKEYGVRPFPCPSHRKRCVRGHVAVDWLSICAATGNILPGCTSDDRSQHDLHRRSLLRQETHGTLIWDEVAA